MPKHTTDATAKFRSASARRSTTGFSVSSSQHVAPTMPAAATSPASRIVGRGEPVVVLAAVQHELQRAEAEGDQRQADIVHVDQPGAVGAHPGRVLDKLRDGEEGEDADRHVDQEYPAPGPGVGQPAAQHRVPGSVRR